MPTATLSEGFEGTNGTAVATGNVSIASSLTGAGTCTFSTAIKKAGTSSAHFTNAASLRYMAFSTVDLTQSRMWSFYLYPVAWPSATTFVHYVGATSSTSNRTAVLSWLTDGTVKISNNAATIISTATTTPLPLNEWSRIDWWVMGPNVGLNVFPGNAQCDGTLALASESRYGVTTPSTNVLGPLPYQELGTSVSGNNEFYLDGFVAYNVPQSFEGESLGEFGNSFVGRSLFVPVSTVAVSLTTGQLWPRSS